MARGVRLFYAARPVRFLRPLLALSALLAASLAAGCAPQMGDSCDTSANCSINGDRVCDIAQPGGYCTIFDCQANNCPDDAVCVRFNPDPARRAVVACMRRCGGDGDCQGRDFRASMFCPGRTYAHRGSCEIDRLLDLSGAATR